MDPATILAGMAEALGGPVATDAEIERTRDHLAAERKPPVVEIYRGARIRQDPESGFYSGAWNQDFGYADTVEEIRQEIDDYLAGPDDDRARQAIGWPNASEA